MEEKTVFYENFDLSEVVTPVKANLFAQKLTDSGYPEEDIQFLYSGFKNSLDLCYEGPAERRSESQNIPFTVGNQVILWNKLMKEVELKRVAGPYKKPSFEHFIQSPIGLVPKAGGDGTRLIFHLSFDFKHDGLKSVNYYTPKERCSVKYRDLDFAVQTFLDLLEDEPCEVQPHANRKSWKNKFKNHKKHKVIYSGKSDMKSAFRLLGLLPKSWAWLVMKARNLLTGEWCYFVDKCLPFGASIICALFQHFSDALCHLTESKLKVRCRITNYLDDFLFIAMQLAFCNRMIKSFLDLCRELAIPVAMEKTEWVSELTIFLGILLDGRHLMLIIPEEKRQVAINLLEEMLAKRKAKVKDMQRLCGYLNFICKAVFPGRTFVR